MPLKVRIPHTGWELLTKKELIEWWQHATDRTGRQVRRVITRQLMNISAHGVDMTPLLMMAWKPSVGAGSEKTSKNQRGLRQKWRWQQTRQSQLREHHDWHYWWAWWQLSCGISHLGWVAYIQLSLCGR